MAKKIYEETNIAAIAERIRANTGGTDTYNTEEMAGGVDEVYAAGISDGKKAEYDAFWDEYQNNGNRANCNHMFAGRGWNSDTFKPKYDIKPKNAYMIFRECGLSGDLVAILDAVGIELDFSNATDGQMAFATTTFTRVGIIDLSNFTSASQANYLFMQSSKLVTIDRLILPNTQLNLTDAFSSCTALKNITIEGQIRYNFDVKSCPLTHDSLMSIINALGDGLSHTLTIGETNLAKLTQDEIDIAEAKGWTVK